MQCRLVSLHRNRYPFSSIDDRNINNRFFGLDLQKQLIPRKYIIQANTNICLHALLIFVS